MTVRVFLLDDHEVVRRGLRDMIEAEEDLTVAGEAGTAAEALTRIPPTRPGWRRRTRTARAPSRTGRIRSATPT